MTEPPKYEQLTAEVADAELIPTGRFLSAEEIELLEDLATRLRAALIGDGSEEITRLLRRVSAIRTYARRSHATSTSATATGKRPATPTATEGAAATPIPPPAGTRTSKRKKKGPSRGTQKARTQGYSLQLRRIAQAGRPMIPSDAQTLNRLIAELEALSRRVPMARMLYTQALDTRAYLTGGSSAPDRDRSGVPSAGWISRPRGLDMPRRGVSGGLPGTRRGH